MSTKVEMKDIVNLSQVRWFVYQWSEIYWGLANSWDYAPYWALLKENIKNLWIKEFVQKRTDMTLLDAAILMNPKTWVASWHVWGFSDPLVDCNACKKRFRADKLIDGFTENHLNDERFWWNLEMDKRINSLMDVFAKGWVKVPSLISEAWENDLQLEFLKEAKYTKWDKIHMIDCPDCWNHDWWKIQKFNLMFKTFQWVTEDNTATVYLRPETAQWIFVNFANLLRSTRRKIPFGVAQVGKAFRNEITPGNFIFRTREFEQMEIEYFCEPGTDLETHAKWKKDCMNFLTNKIWIDWELLRYRDHDADELSHYSNATTDIEFKFPFGWWELRGIADRTDFDLKAHMHESKQDLSYFDPVNNKKYIPYVIEPSVWLTRLFLATLINAYTIDEENDRTYLKFEPRVAPIKIWVLPVVKKIADLWKEIYAQLSEDFVCEYDDVWSIWKRFARMDEIWVPFCISIDSTNYDEWNVTVRHRDSMEQEIVKISDLNEFFREKLK